MLLSSSGSFYSYTAVSRFCSEAADLRGRFCINFRQYSLASSTELLPHTFFFFSPSLSLHLLPPLPTLYQVIRIIGVFDCHRVWNARVFFLSVLNFTKRLEEEEEEEEECRKENGEGLHFPFSTRIRTCPGYNKRSERSVQRFLMGSPLSRIITFLPVRRCPRFDIPDNRSPGCYFASIMHG